MATPTPRSREEVEKLMTAPTAMWANEQVDIKGRKVKVYKHLPPALKDLWAASKAFGAREFLVYQDQRITYDQSHELVNKTASLLISHGVTKGDKVAIVARNLPEWVICFWACHQLGAVATCCNAFNPKDILLHCLSLAEPKVIFADGQRAQLLSGESEIKALKSMGCKGFYVIEKGVKPTGEFQPFEDVLLKHQSSELPKVEVAADDEAILFFTSGTTNKPKGVLSTQRMMLSNLFNTLSASGRTFLLKGEEIPVPDPNVQKAVLLPIPLFHVTACHSFMQVVTAVGGKLVLMHHWDVPEAVKLIVDEKCTSTGGVPHMVMEIMHALKGVKTNLEGYSFGGGPASARLPEFAEKLTPGVLPAQGYGLTETNAVATGFAGSEYIERPTSVGRATAVTEIKITDFETGKELPAGQAGEICIRGPNVALCYYKNEKATKEAFMPDGWFKSGDVGYLDQDGFLFLSDRLKDIIIVKGENVASVSVENALYVDDRVKDAAVVALKDEVAGELIAACVVVHDQHKGKVTQKELQQIVAKSLPKHCVPSFIVFVDEMERNATGKSMKNEIKTKMNKLWEEAKHKAEQVKAKL